MKRYFIYDANPTDNGGGDTALIMKSISDLGGNLENKQKETAEAVKKELGGQLGTVTGELETVRKEFSAVKDEVTAVKGELTELKKKAGKMFVSNGGEQKQKSFNEILGDTIERNAEQIKNYRKEQGLVGFDMLPDFKEKGKDGIREIKAVGDMSISANFSTANTFTQDVRSNLIETPFERLWLADILPQGTSNGSSILYPKENGGEGGAALWTDKTADKAQMDFDITGQSAYFKWIAGFVIVEREMLDDISWLTSYLQRKMLISLKTAENAFVLDGSGDSNPVTGMNSAATAYTGGFSNQVDRIIDGAWGQIVEDTFDQYNPTNVILTPRNAVAVGLNTATGSGEYNLPAGSVAFANGQLTIGGLQVVKTTSVGTGNFLAFDRNALMFVRRLQPELRMFEDAALAKKNKIMFRIEERATLAIFNNKALVKGTLSAV